MSYRCHFVTNLYQFVYFLILFITCLGSHATMVIFKRQKTVSAPVSCWTAGLVYRDWKKSIRNKNVVPMLIICYRIWFIFRVFRFTFNLYPWSFEENTLESKYNTWKLLFHPFIVCWTITSSAWLIVLPAHFLCWFFPFLVCTSIYANIHTCWKY